MSAEPGGDWILGGGGAAMKNDRVDWFDVFRSALVHSPRCGEREREARSQAESHEDVFLRGRRKRRTHARTALAGDLHALAEGRELVHAQERERVLGRLVDEDGLVEREPRQVAQVERLGDVRDEGERRRARLALVDARLLALDRDGRRDVVVRVGEGQVEEALARVLLLGLDERGDLLGLGRGRGAGDGFGDAPELGARGGEVRDVGRVGRRGEEGREADPGRLAQEEAREEVARLVCRRARMYVSSLVQERTRR